MASINKEWVMNRSNLNSLRRAAIDAADEISVSDDAERWLRELAEVAARLMRVIE
ncbi:hypothetical protein JW710_00525 [Candidatus Dojkabacteria bacterium]|nr:hypothetical protein [Candidatus Dojkabacteria bacterium]